MATLSSNSISFSYSGEPLLKEISIALSNGERIALAGDNGSGKTTLSLILAGILRPQKGSVEMDGISPWNGDGRYEFRKRVGYVFQNPEDGFVANDVRRELAFAAENIGVPSKELHERINNLAERLDMQKFLSHSPLTLCGGMKARLAIASALATGADFLLLDEPESFLDIRGQVAFESALDEIQHHSGILHITRTRELASKCNRAFIIKNGTLRLACDEDFAPVHLLKPLELHSGNEVLLSLNKVSFSYEDSEVLNEITFDLHRGEIVGIVGASGSGKTTLALACAGILNPSGKIFCKGRVAMALQFPERQLFGETVYEDVLYGPRNFGFDNADSITCETLELFEIDKSFWSISPFELSDGQQRRVGLAGVVASKPDVLILDEPFASLDRMGILKLCGNIEKLAQNGTAIMLISHKTDLLAQIAPRAVALDNGTIVFDGNTKMLLSNTSICEQIGIKPIEVTSLK